MTTSPVSKLYCISEKQHLTVANRGARNVTNTYALTATHITSFQKQHKKHKLLETPFLDDLPKFTFCMITKCEKHEEA